MKKENWNKQSVSLVWFLGVALQFFFFLFADCFDGTPMRRFLQNGTSEAIPPEKEGGSQGVMLYNDENNQVEVDNGLMRITIAKPGGYVLGIQYKGIDNILEIRNEAEDRGYWDVFWNEPGRLGIDERLAGIKFSIITNTRLQVELSFSFTWDDSLSGKKVPFNVDKRYIIRQGISGFHQYAIFNRLQGWPAAEVDQIRVVYKLRKQMFRYMAITDDIQRVMPTDKDRQTGQPLAYPEAVLLTDPVDPKMRGQVDDKYQYSLDDINNTVHGWIAQSNDPPVGFWMITPSDEFRTAGPTKQDLTSHAGPITLNMFVSLHYAGFDVAMMFKEGEPWKKVFGPYFVYLNSATTQTDSLQLWTDAKAQLGKEIQSWPYDFTKSNDFPPSSQRGTVSGQLQVQERFGDTTQMPGESAYVGLALPGEVGSWQLENKGYQFWVQADEEGSFTIANIRPGTYNLYAWVPGVIGDFKHDAAITIEPSSNIELGALVYEPPRNGPTLWEIGIPDRKAAEFYVPNPSPTLMNPLFNDRSSGHKYRQYGLWEQYSDIYRDQDLVYTVGESNYEKDLFYAQVTRNVDDKTYEGTIWQIVFNLANVTSNGNYTLQIALASAHMAELQVRINDEDSSALFTTGLIGKDNAIARHGIHGLYYQYTIGVPSDKLQQGSNTLFLRQSRGGSPYTGLMYDYLRFEGPSS